MEDKVEKLTSWLHLAATARSDVWGRRDPEAGGVPAAACRTHTFHFRLEPMLGGLLPAMLKWKAMTRILSRTTNYDDTHGSYTGKPSHSQVSLRPNIFQSLAQRLTRCTII